MQVIVCECHTPEHHILFEYEDGQVCIQVHLNNLSFWERLKYLFGFKTKYGEYDTILLKKEDVEKILKAFEEKE